MYYTIAECIKDLMLSKDIEYIWKGTPFIFEECASKLNLKRSHPLNNIDSILNSLDKSDIFEKTYIKGNCCGREVWYRCFKIKDYYLNK
ncbi:MULTISPECIES: hypothetical protein [Anaerofustis]|uniref:hypothetical protein n=1 Tax=Anaerofustis TaxID=264995 RepID=UPI001106EDEF|nr:MULTISPECIES: hypothetical protein [Anaerofustis]MCO8194416.1 hypothetical protein [Anaerofustis sp. NSJ-163]